MSMTIKKKIEAYVKAQGNQVGSGAELGEILDEMVDSMPGPPGPQGPQGPQGNTGSSVDYPYELVNNLTTDDPEKGLSAAQGVVLKGEISQLGQEMVARVFRFPNDLIYEKWINTSGQLIDGTNNLCTDFLKVYQGDKLKYKLRVANGDGLIAFYTSNDVSTFVLASSVFQSGSSYTDGEWTAPQDGYIIIDCRKDTLVNSYSYFEYIPTATDKKIDALQESVTQGFKANAEKIAITEFRLFQFPNDMTNKGELDGSGRYTENNRYRTSNYLKVLSGDEIKYRLKAVTGDCCIAFYTTDDESSFDLQYSIIQSSGNSPMAGTWVAPFDGYVRIGIFADPIRSDTYAYGNYIPQSEVKQFAAINSSITLLDNKTVEHFAVVDAKLFRFDSDMNNNGELDSTGKFVANANYRASDFLRVNSGDKLIYNLRTVANDYYIAFYTELSESSFDSNNSLLFISGGYKKGTWVAPSNGYVRLGIHKTATDSYARFEKKCSSEVEYRLDLLENGIGSVIKDNEDIFDVVKGSARFGLPGNSKFFQMILSGDIHGNQSCMSDIISYLNFVPSFDMGIMAGDIVGSVSSDDSTFYTDAISKTTKPFLTCIGNHDMSGIASVAAGVTKYITPNIQYANLTTGEYSDGAGYYFKDFADYGIRVIVLNQYDSPQNIGLNNGYPCYSQGQLDWFITILKSAAVLGYSVIIAMHSGPEDMIPEDVLFTSKNIGARLSVNNQIDGSPISDIVDAWTNNSSLQKVYNLIPQGGSTSVGTVSVDEDFSNDNAGLFVCYIGGHWHPAVISHCKEHPNQKCVSVEVANGGNTATQGCDMPRSAGRSKNCFYALSIDTESRKINIVAIGAHFTYEMINRNWSVVEY